MRDPAVILHATARTLDLSEPVALLFIGVLGHLADYEQARSVVGGLLGRVPLIFGVGSCRSGRCWID